MLTKMLTSESTGEDRCCCEECGVNRVSSLVNIWMTLASPFSLSLCYVNVCVCLCVGVQWKMNIQRSIYTILFLLLSCWELGFLLAKLLDLGGKMVRDKNGRHCRVLMTEHKKEPETIWEIKEVCWQASEKESLLILEHFKKWRMRTGQLCQEVGLSGAEEGGFLESISVSCVL